MTLSVITAVSLVLKRSIELNFRFDFGPICKENNNLIPVYVMV